MQETGVQSLGGGEPLEKERATQSSPLAWCLILLFIEQGLWEAQGGKQADMGGKSGPKRWWWTQAWEKGAQGP